MCRFVVIVPDESTINPEPRYSPEELADLTGTTAGIALVAICAGVSSFPETAVSELQALEEKDGDHDQGILLRGRPMACHPPMHGGLKDYR